MTEKFHAYTRGSQEAVEYDPEVYNTYAGWRWLGHQVLRGQKARLFTGNGVALFHWDQTDAPKKTAPPTPPTPKREEPLLDKKLSDYPDDYDYDGDDIPF